MSPGRRRTSSLHWHTIRSMNNRAIVKGDGGIIGITENEAALKRWMVAGPRMSRHLSQYEEKHTHRRVDDDRHHEQIPSTQKKFALNTNTVVEAIEELGNPFADDTTDLATLDTKVIMSEEVVTTIQTAKQLGSTQYQSFIDERMSG